MKMAAATKERLWECIQKDAVEEVRSAATSGLLWELWDSSDGMESPLHIAVLEGSAHMVDMLLETTDYLAATNIHGETPLHLACHHGKTDYVRKLLSHGAELDPKDSAECSPLFHAVSRNHVGVVRLLIEAGCDLDTLNEELITPLDYAILHNKREIISLLLKGGCAIDKWAGPIVYQDYCAYSIVFPLWGNCDQKNIQLLVDCGYTTEYSHIRTMLELLRKRYWDDNSLHTLVTLTEQPQSLSSLCRISIRRVFHTRRYEVGGSVEAMIDRLRLPEKLKCYLAIRDS